MRHRSNKLGFGRTPEYRKALLRSLAAGLVLHEKIKTTEARARALRPYAERLVTLAKVDSVAGRRKAGRALSHKSAVKKLFLVLGPKYRGRPGGYVRIRKASPRAGDAGKQAIISFV
ncbi:MAG: 50S ribosomal protein L17 [Parcubacteria group bacterium]|nr:50S ribosomal protein L17 [Parcubacteria group bacterium]